MIWFILLGGMIEPRLRAYKYLLLIFSIACISNTAQYLVSGPAFLGISGVICGMAGFISSRQHSAPWEAYPMQRQAYQFLIFSIWLLLMLSLVMFLFSLYGLSFPVSFGNTAHVSGLLAGKILGKTSFFSTPKRSRVIKFS
jgi:GlpG protein